MFKYKYVKYKTKYNRLKGLVQEMGLEELMQEMGLEELVKQRGGHGKLVIHISGPSGSGKTVMGGKLKDMFGNRIVVKDTDDLLSEFIDTEYNGRIDEIISKEKYQEYIDVYVRAQTKPLVLVGLNRIPWWHKGVYYDMHADHKYYIKLDNETIFKQKCSRYLNDVFVTERDHTLDDIITDEKLAIAQINDALNHECSYAETTNLNSVWNRDYKTQGYTYMAPDDILRDVIDLLNEYLGTHE